MTIIYAIFALFGIALGLMAREIYLLRNRLTILMGGAKSENLETAVHGYYKRVQAVSVTLDELRADYDRITSMSERALGKVGIVRYNPFGDTGGDQSFSLAVINNQDSGYVLTSIHGREGTRIYMKPVDGGVSTYPLAAEEQQALATAIKPSTAKQSTRKEL